MPCRCDYDEYEERKADARRQKLEAEEAKMTVSREEYNSLNSEHMKLVNTYNRLKRDCDIVTQLLCYMCGQAEHHGTLNNSVFDRRLLEWWKKHNDYDHTRTLETFKKMFGTNPDQIPSRETVYNWFVNQANAVHPLSEFHRGKFFDEIWEQFTSWHKSYKARQDRIAALEAELAELKAEDTKSKKSA